jgi:hypothetical protein
VVSALEGRFLDVTAAAADALAAATADPWVKGSKGQPRPHPGFEVAARLDAVAVRIATELRMAGKQLSDDERTGFDALDELARRRGMS